MTYHYYVVEDRVYRAPTQDLRQMERWSPLSRQWERYAGDGAKILIEGTHYGTRRPPELGR